MGKINQLIYTIITNLLYKNKIHGKGKIITNSNVFLKLAKSSKLNLEKNLILNGNSFGNNNRSSILRMDNNAELTTNGKFSFFYGADIILFENAKLYLGSGSFINSDCKIRCHEKEYMPLFPGTSANQAPPVQVLRHRQGLTLLR